MQDHVEAEYTGDYQGQVYTVQVLPGTALEPTNRGQRVVLRIRFRAATRAVLATIGNRRSEHLIHEAVRRRIDAGWPD
jgi:hypothetical protein